jgi:RNA-directed DNA polymerase
MRYPASEKAEIIQLVEQSHLPAKRTLDKLGIPRATFYRWYDRYREGGPEALGDHRSRPDRVWNRIPDNVRRQIIDLALDLPELSPRELAVRFTDERKYFVSEASVYRLLKAHDLITSPAYVVIKAANEFKDKTTAINQLWQTDFTYLKITGWGWYYLSTVLDDFSRYIVAWKLCATMCADDVTATLDLALSASGLDHVTVVHPAKATLRQRLILRCRRSGQVARGQGHGTCARGAVSPPNSGKDRALAPDPEKSHSTRKLLPARRSRTADRSLRRAL